MRVLIGDALMENYEKKREGKDVVGQAATKLNKLFRRMWYTAFQLVNTFFNKASDLKF